MIDRVKGEEMISLLGGRRCFRKEEESKTK